MTDSEPAGRWAVLALLGFAELLGMSVWFTASAVSSELRELWGLSYGATGWLTTVVQFGFVAGTAGAALLNLADVLPSRFYFAIAAFLAAGANALLVVAPGFGVALILRFLTGFFLAGVYPPAMKMIATWFRSARGFAIGTIVGALTIGKAAPYLLKSLEGTSIALVVLSASAAAGLGGLLVLIAYRDGPFAFTRRPFHWGLVAQVLQHRETRLATAGSLGHMWELYAMWTAIALFYLDFFQAHGTSLARATSWAALAGFGAISVGALGAILAGAWADRLGREEVTVGAMAVSGACALAMGWLVNAPVWLVVPLGLVWGFSVVADSAQFSALVTELAPSDAVGTALTLQTSLGFLLTGASIWLTLVLREVGGWPLAFSVLALGPAYGIWAMTRLRSLRRAG